MSWEASQISLPPSDRMRRVLRVTLWFLAGIVVLLVVVLTVVTNPVKARPFEAGVSVDALRLRADVEVLTPFFATRTITWFAMPQTPSTMSGWPTE